MGRSDSRRVVTTAIVVSVIALVGCTRHGWGQNDVGQMGNGMTGNPFPPAQVDGIVDWVALATSASSAGTGGSHGCGIRTNASLWCWGENGSGQVGDGTAGARHSPVQITGATWKAVSGGGYHTCGIRSDRSLWCWGANLSGQIGDGTSGPGTDRPSPVKIGDAEWQGIAGGGVHTCGIRVDGSLWCWGGNVQGALGDGTREQRSSPVRIGLSSWSAISADGSHSCGIRTDGSLWCWGSDSDGQVGNGPSPFDDQLTPVQVGTATWKSVTTGGQHTCAIRSDDSLWCWGRNAQGHLGDGTTDQRLAPVRIGATTWKTVSAGWSHTCGIQSVGSLWCWGFNNQQQLGDGTTVTRRLAPTRVGADTRWLTVEAQTNFSHAVLTH